MLTVDCWWAVEYSAEHNTDEYKSQMSMYDKTLAKNLNAQNTSLPMGDIPDWNRLVSTSELDPEFNEEFNKVISDCGIPDADEEHMKGDHDDLLNIHEEMNCV